jgi:hypothetical protein
MRLPQRPAGPSAAEAATAVPPSGGSGGFPASGCHGHRSDPGGGASGCGGTSGSGAYGGAHPGQVLIARRNPVWPSEVSAVEAVRAEVRYRRQ